MNMALAIGKIGAAAQLMVGAVVAVFLLSLPQLYVPVSLTGRNAHCSQ
jgi:hypothetical protein